MELGKLVEAGRKKRLSLKKILETGKRKKIGRSSSLQDFSSYDQLDPEVGRLDPEIADLITPTGENLIYFKHSHLLESVNGGSSFANEKALPRNHHSQKKWVRVIMVLLYLLLFFVLVYMVHFSFTRWSRGTSKFHVLLDCGSTGTRIYVYKASFNYNKDVNLPISLKLFPEVPLMKHNSQNGRAYTGVETEPGLDKLVYNISGLKRAIKPLIKWAKKQIPSDFHKTTSLYLYATAGIRRLPISDSQWILNNTWSILKSSPFLCEKQWVKIISGTEKAYYGWIALNYHTGVLGSIPKKATFGALDLGGSSLQVTFESHEQVHNETSVELSIGSLNHHLSAYSLSGYGLNDAFEKSVVHLFKKIPNIDSATVASGNIDIKHPCLQSGYKEQYLCLQCNPFNKVKNMVKNGNPGFQIQLIGDPNWEKCKELTKVAVNLYEWSDNLPRPYGQFYALSGFFVVYRFFNLTSDSSLDDVLEKGQEFCSKSWQIAEKSVPSQPFIEQYCFRSPYIVQLLREGLHISDRQIIIGSGSITWTLGVALLEAGKAFSTKTRLRSFKLPQMKNNFVVPLAILFGSFLLLLSALLCAGAWMPRYMHRRISIFKHNSLPSTSVNIPTPLRLQRWTPLSSGDNRVKMPLSPTIVDTQYRPFGTNNFFGGGVAQLTESSLYSSGSSVTHSYSSGSLGLMQSDKSSLGSFWPPHRSQMHLQSRRSQSREDLSSSASEGHSVKDRA